jgi:hypothetical protein
VRRRESASKMHAERSGTVCSTYRDMLTSRSEATFLRCSGSTWSTPVLSARKLLDFRLLTHFCRSRSMCCVPSSQPRQVLRKGGNCGRAWLTWDFSTRITGRCTRARHVCWLRSTGAGRPCRKQKVAVRTERHPGWLFQGDTACERRRGHRQERGGRVASQGRLLLPAPAKQPGRVAIFISWRDVQSGS